jgi:uridylate kinase
LRVVLRIGGSVLGSPPDPELVNGYSDIVSKLTGENNSLAVVVGGGPISRKYIESAKGVGLSAFHQDLIAIHTSRLNARLVAMKMGGVSSIPTSINSMLQRLARNRVAVMGGLKPGITTDTVAAMLAQKWPADLLIKASNQSGVYTGDPKIHKNAKKLQSMSYAQLREILGGKHTPGIHSIIDPVAVDQLSQTRTKLVVIDGREPKNVMKAIHGEKVGTTVS